LEQIEQFAARTEFVTDVELDNLYLHYREIAITLSLAVRYSQQTDGDIAEFGTATGVTARTLARALAKERGSSKNLHLFDSFEGLPEATSNVDANSYEFINRIWFAGLMKDLNSRELLYLCSKHLPSDRIVIHEGWFVDTVKNLKGKKFAMVHFDGDMYQSAIDAIGGLLSQGAISNGAVICFDDWNCGQANPAFGERRAWQELSDKHKIVCSPWRCYSSMGQAFIVHSYCA
jgi:predicted O-methyltransferase YrrM